MKRSATAKQRRNFTREFKFEAVRRIAAEGKSLAEIARELDLGESLLRSWKAALTVEGEQATPGKGNTPAVAEELRRRGRASSSSLRSSTTESVAIRRWATSPRSSTNAPDNR